MQYEGITRFPRHMRRQFQLMRRFKRLHPRHKQKYISMLHGLSEDQKIILIRDNPELLGFWASLVKGVGKGIGAIARGIKRARDRKRGQAEESQRSQAAAQTAQIEAQKKAEAEKKARARAIAIRKRKARALAAKKAKQKKMLIMAGAGVAGVAVLALLLTRKK